MGYAVSRWAAFGAVRGLGSTRMPFGVGRTRGQAPKPRSGAPQAQGPAVARAYVLANHDGEPADVVRRRFDGLLGAMHQHRAKAGTLARAVDHFRKACP